MVPLNVPNVLTVVRILLVPVLVVALLDKTSGGDLLAVSVPRQVVIQPVLLVAQRGPRPEAFGLASMHGGEGLLDHGLTV